MRIGQFGRSGFPGDIDPGDLFGESVASVGDLDGDGIPDLLVGAPQDDDQGSDRGAAWIIFFNAEGSVQAVQKLSDSQGGFSGTLADHDFFGVSVAPLGDLDGDGTNDIAIGASGDGIEGANFGAIWILFLNPDGTVKAHQKIGQGLGGFAGVLDDNDRFGASLANLGDIDGDGVVDLIVGAFLDDDGGENRGAAWILFLRPDGTVRAEQKISDGHGGFFGGLDDGDEFGISVAGLGDLDADGVSDVAIGAHLDGDGGLGRGAVWIMFLESNGTVKGHQKLSDTAGGFTGELDDRDFFGISTANLGDLNDDGVVDLAVGAIRDDDGGENRGAFWTLFLNRDGTVRRHTKVSQSDGDFGSLLCNYANFGRSVALLGDLDGDGRAEIVAGAYAIDDQEYPGDVWLLRLNDCSPRPDPCPADFDGDGVLTIFDFLAFQNAFAAGCP